MAALETPTTQESRPQLDDIDRQLLDLLQGSFPLDPRPYAAVAELAGLSEDEVLTRTQRLKDERIIRQVTAIFDTRSLGYQSMLVAAKVNPQAPHRAAKVVNEHPGVSHNYLRNHDFNLWFTIAVSPNSRLGLERTLELLSQEAGFEAFRQLPTLTLFKINMNLQMTGGSDALKVKQEVAPPRELGVVELDERDRKLIWTLQGDLPVESEPFNATASELGISVDELLDHCRELTERGVLRRTAAILYHRRAGFAANGMGVWNVPEDQIAEYGPRMAAYRGISHCYQRPTYEDWPYSIFTMAHGRSKEECDAILAQIATDMQISDYTTLYSSTEYKKVRLTYFSPEFETWEGSRL